MITSVNKTQTKVKTIRPTSNVLNFENVYDLLKYMSTVAFQQNKMIYPSCSFAGSDGPCPC